MTNRKGQDTKTRLLETTARLLEEQGFHATGLNQIVAESRAPKGVLYHHFPGGKDELAVEAVKLRGRRVAENIRRRLEEHDDPAEAVRAFARYLAASLETSGCRTGGPVATPALESTASSEALREACRDAYLAWEEVFKEKLLAGGLSEARADTLATTCTAALEGAIILMRTRLDADPLRRVGDELATLIRAAYGG